MNAQAHNVSERIGRSLTRDPKKSGLLAVLVMLMLVLWGRAFTGEGSGPAPALATPLAGDAVLPQALGGPARRSDEAGAMLLEWTRAPLAPVGRNLFHVRLDYFAQDPSRRPAIAAETRVETFWDELAKSLAAQADQRKERQILLENLQRQAAQLRIQTIVMGEKPRAMINGELVGEGDVAANFRVLRIESRRVVVEREGVRLEILMH